MATIRPNENAPAEEVHYVLPTVEFDLDAGGSFETDDRAALSAAADHPWLEVEYPEVAAEVYSAPSKSVPYRDDPFSEFNDFSNDPARVEETERSKYSGTVAPLAVDAGLDQGEVVTADERVDLTLAAAAEHNDDTAEEPTEERNY
jgi:hypothetical protein